MNATISFDSVLHVVLALVGVAVFVGLNGLLLVYAERKVAGFIQRRPGPYEVGPQGILQAVADALKLIGKQLVRPDRADPLLFWMAPVLAFFPVLLLFLPIPFSPLLTGWDVNLGLLLILAFAGFNVLALLLAGWGSNNKYGLLGAARAVAQSVAYEIPLLLAVLAIAFQEGTLSLSAIVGGQGGMPWQWNIAVQPLAFLIFFVSALGETNRAPFDLPEAESELTAGFHTEYSGMGFGMFFLAEYANMIVACSVCTVLFLGGWKGPFLDGAWWFLAKVYGLLLTMMWFRWTYPRVRFDQLLNLNWRWLLPLGVLNLLATAFVMKL
ncbi:NADH-quinone oxidoreductase subunit NuoH [Nitratidesulfovibrio liaohensis]|uniref:NADH-quinone oxidoreductase subunit NuoH n=1 Tax=Nitratidesulfovibrio liaohensis TaxID=2604158 RepID=UPI00141FEFEA|nr:NADH-quinone oxidoreductase subunit NuoH [Nitratidesulfovibrio liaohensis]NHZ47688.1 NADH-quinone oxidoreductase subunit NuoH [Nitratidesulfovibrio liaohensis]